MPRLSGNDVFFVTDGSLVGTDPGSSTSTTPASAAASQNRSKKIPCFGDACQNLPREPVDPALTTLVSGPGNPDTT